LCDVEPSRAALDLAEAWCQPVHFTAGDWLTPADWVFSCVPGSQALHVVEEALPFVRGNAGIADLTTASPDVKRRAAALAAERSVRYVDMALMGAIALNGVRTPLLASGDGAAEVRALLEPAGSCVQVIEGGRPGDAIALKILRSVFTKGLEALAVELLTSAEKQGVRDQLYEQLGDIDRTPLRNFIDMLVRTHVVHAKRRTHEVQVAQAELASQGTPSLVLPGVERRFLATVRKLDQHAIGVTDPSLDQALQWLLATGEPA
jgi:3-hydroxyisobutyrate dehydrogenase-like beta-hydroxyacid dehydrogenase